MEPTPYGAAHTRRSIRRKMKKHRCTPFLLISLLLTLLGNSYGETENLDDLAARLAKNADLPGLGIGVIKNGEITGIGCTGNGESKLTHESKYVIASCSKAITATLAARLVSEGYIQWDTTLIDVFPEFADTMHKHFEPVTLSQLLQHSGGAPERDEFWRSDELRKAIHINGSPMQQRYELLKLITLKNPSYSPGSKMVYSNAGYYMVAAMLEKATGESWESLVQEKIFTPLGMTASSATSDIDPALTMPAGGVSCTVSDFAKFCLFHFEYDSNNPLHMKKSDYRTLHKKSKKSDYSMGFLLVERDWAEGEAYTHGGLNRKFTSVFWLAPEIDFGVIAFTTESDEVSGEKLDAAVWELIQSRI